MVQDFTNLVSYCTIKGHYTLLYNTAKVFLTLIWPANFLELSSSSIKSRKYLFLGNINCAFWLTTRYKTFKFSTVQNSSSELYSKAESSWRFFKPSEIYCNITIRMSQPGFKTSNVNYLRTTVEWWPIYYLAAPMYLCNSPQTLKKHPIS